MFSVFSKSSSNHKSSANQDQQQPHPLKRRGAVKHKSPSRSNQDNQSYLAADRSRSSSPPRRMSGDDVALRDTEPPLPPPQVEPTSAQIEITEEPDDPMSEEENVEIEVESEVEESEEARAHLELAEKIVAAQRKHDTPRVFRQVTLLTEDIHGNVIVESVEYPDEEKEVTNIMEDGSAQVMDSDDDVDEENKRQLPNLADQMARLGVQPVNRRLSDSSEASALTEDEYLSDRETTSSSVTDNPKGACRKKQRRPPPLVLTHMDDSDSDDADDIIRSSKATRGQAVSLLMPSDIEDGAITDCEDLYVSDDEMNTRKTTSIDQNSNMESVDREPETVVVSRQDVDENVASTDLDN